LKVLRMERLQEWKSLELFVREASALKSLSHEAIPSYVSLFWTGADGAHELDRIQVEELVDGGALVLAQQLAPGASLAAKLADGWRPTDEQALTILRQLLEVLTYLHEQNPPMIHRDVTPKNIIVDDQLRAWLVDFGAIQHTLQLNTVGGSTTVGTLGYIPIEQSVGKARPASDLYALGVTMVVILTGLEPEQLPLDEATSKIDLRALGLEVDQSAEDLARQALRHAISAMIEPLMSARASAAREVISLLDASLAGKAPQRALVRAAPTELEQLAQIRRAGRLRMLFILALGGSIGSAVIIYPLNFNNFSETQMVQMAPVWILPAAFGFFGLLAGKNPRPLIVASVGAIGTLGALFFFFAVIWPAL
jgi:serine/threonine protein kinase